MAAVQDAARIGRFDVISTLGRGAQGTVYLAEDSSLGRRVAVKTIHLERVDGPTQAHETEVMLGEARIAGKLSHPNIVTLFDAGEDAGAPYLVFEFVEGETLDDPCSRYCAIRRSWRSARNLQADSRRRQPYRDRCRMGQKGRKGHKGHKGRKGRKGHKGHKGRKGHKGHKDHKDHSPRRQLKSSGAFLPPLQGEGWGRDGVVSDETSSPSPFLTSPLKGEG